MWRTLYKTVSIFDTLRAIYFNFIGVMILLTVISALDISIPTAITYSKYALGLLLIFFGIVYYSTQILLKFLAHRIQNMMLYVSQVDFADVYDFWQVTSIYAQNKLTFLGFALGLVILGEYIITFL